MLLSIGLMVKNESKYLKQCLGALVPILQALDSELIIVDTGSTDNTVEIAKEFTDKVYHHEWNDDFSAMRNIVLSYTTGEWFFYVDGDEILVEPQGIIDFFKSKRYKRFNSAFIEMKSFSSSNSDHYGIFQALRLFRNEKGFHFKGMIHEQPQAKGPVVKVDGYIVHYGYLSDDKDLMEYKFQRNVKLINKVLEDDPENIYHLFQLSQSYAMYGKHKLALEPIEKAYRIAKSKKELAKHMNVVNQLAGVYFKNQMYIECIDKCKEGLSLRDGYLDLYYYLAVSQAEIGMFKESIFNFQRYMSILDDHEQGIGIVDLTLAHGTVTNGEQACVILCNIHKKLSNHDQVIKYGSMVKNPQLVLNVIPHLVDIYLGEGNIRALKELYDKWSFNEDVKPAIERAIESKRMGMEGEERRELSILFAKENTPYGFLNTIRNEYVENDNTIPSKVWDEIHDLDLSKREVYYADCMLLFVQRKQSVVDLLRAIRNDKITGFFAHLFRSYEDFLDLFKTFLVNEDSWLTHEQDMGHVQRIKTTALYALLQYGNLTDEEYNYFFLLYVEVGVKYIEACYNQQIIDRADMAMIKTDADAFLTIMRLAMQVEKTSVEYVQLLRQALSQDETMKKGIELLLSEVQDQLSGEPEKNEFEALKDSVMGSIKEAISSGELETAIALVNEFEDIVGSDAKLASAKGIIMMLEGRFEESKQVFRAGLELAPNDPDLNYNMGYLCEQQSYRVEAIKHYSKAKLISKDEHLISDVNNALARLQATGLDEPSSVDLPDDSVRILYLGWLGMNNIGDELLYDVFKTLLYRQLPEDSPTVLVELFYPNASSVANFEKYDLVVLGGGSLLGIPYWHDLVLQAHRFGIPTVIWGTGFDFRDGNQVKAIVNEYEINGNNFVYRHEAAGEMVRVAYPVGVRGQLDKLLIGEERVEVIGDPGIIWKHLEQKTKVIPQVAKISPDQRVILVNWGTSLNNIIGNNETQLRDELVKTIKVLVGKGYTIVVYPIWSEDIKPCQELVSKVNSNDVILLNHVHDVYGLAYLMERAYFSINFKLHANILSASYGKPFISLAYGLKCYDFADSVDSLDLVMFTDKVTSDAILDRVEYVEKNYTQVQDRLNRHVDLYKNKQLTFMNRLISKVFANSVNEGKTPVDKQKDNPCGFMSLGRNVQIEKNNQFIDSQNMEIGNNVYIGFGGYFVASGGIKIGNGSIIAHKVEIMTRNHNYNSDDLESIPYDSKYILKPVVIEENVWIGSNVCIVPGVTIGEGAVIGMGSVVTKNVPKYAVVGGNPAQILKYRDENVYRKLKSENKIYLQKKSDLKGL